MSIEANNKHSITQLWSDMPVTEQVAYLHDLVNRWENYENHEKDNGNSTYLVAGAYALTRAVLKRKIDMEIHHSLPKAPRKPISLNGVWALYVGLKLPYGIHMLQSMLKNVFSDGIEDMEETLWFDKIEIEITLHIAQEILTEMLALGKYEELRSGINDSTLKAKENNYSRSDLISSLRVYKVEESF